MNIYIFLRKTEDWKNVDVEDCKFPLFKAGEQDHVPILREWNKSFPVTWQKYRQSLQDKSFENWKIPILFNINDVLNKNDEDVVIPIDDDDWLHPNIDSIIKSEMRNNDLLQWTQIINEYTIGRSVSKWGKADWQRKIGHCTSDHCLRIGCLKNFSRNDCDHCLNGHGNVWMSFLYKRRMYIPEILSCYNHHIGSHSFLIKIKSIEEIRIAVNQISDNIPNWTTWAEPMIKWLDNESKNVVKNIKCL